MPSASAPFAVYADRPSGPQAVLDRITFDNHKKRSVVGIYASQYGFSEVLGYSGADRKNGPPICTIQEGSDYYAVTDIAVDRKGDLVVPNAGTHNITVYKGPKMCGATLGTIKDTYGQPFDVASLNAASGTIAVANVGDNGNLPGSISVCTLSGGCTRNLTNPNMYFVYGVALAKNGDCWASASPPTSKNSSLTYFRGCEGLGRAATGWKNETPSGLDIDSRGNIVALDVAGGSLRIYRGCDPSCTDVGAFSIRGDSKYGHLNSEGTEFVAGDDDYGSLDVYKYGTTALTYEYSITNGLNYSDALRGAAFNPGSEQNLR